MSWREPDVHAALEVAWRCMRLVQPAGPADAILALGCFDPNVARTAGRLWLAGLAPVVVMSGGLAHQGGLLDTGWNRPEADVFAEAAIELGVPDHAILRERRAMNTGDNFRFSRTLLAEAGIRPRRVLIAALPYTTRRGYATALQLWPDIEVAMQCEAITLDAYLARDPKPERTVHAIAGDLHRLMVYPAMGYQAAQPLPPEAHDALRTLVAAGYDRRLVPGQPV